VLASPYEATQPIFPTFLSIWKLSLQCGVFKKSFQNSFKKFCNFISTLKSRKVEKFYKKYNWSWYKG